MKTYKTSLTILIIAVILMGLIIYYSRNENNTVINNENVATTTNEVATNTPTIVDPQATTTATTTKPSEVFPKDVTISTANYYEFPDGAILSIKQISDSRCATDVNCIWAGNIAARLNIKKGNFSEDFDLKFGADAENSTYSYAGYKVKLSAVTPPKGVVNEIITQKDYKLTITISK